MPLNDKVAVITGATGQLGPAVAHAFAGEGARLVLVGHSQEALSSSFDSYGFRPTRVLQRAVNSTDPNAMLALADHVKGHFGRADILLHLVGGFRGGALRDTTDETWDHMLNVNLRTAVSAIRAFLPMLTANGWGRILTLSSGATQAPQSNITAYLAAKAALESMTIALAQEVKGEGVTANVVLIRSLDTPAERARQPNKVAGWVQPQDVAATLLFLCSNEAGAITGARIPVYGGQ